MEDGSNSTLSDGELLDHTKNGVVTPTMANFPDGVIAISKDDKVNHTENSKVNGDNVTESNVFENDSYSSESDALVIDESVPKKQKGSKRKSTQKPKANEEVPNKDGEVVTHSNPYFNESLFELSQLHQNSNEENLDTTNGDPTSTPVDIKDDKPSKVKPKKSKGKTKPKLREYAQYLGLQPTVQFKCSKCGRAGFESLTTLHDHVIQCNSVQSVQEEITENSFSGFKLTRKVFLCSACGTYYENWNLYMHMLEFHRRYICLYCLGMFSVLDDLCQHIQSRHNLEPGHKDTLDEFFNVYNEPCYVVCCECNKLFNEQDNFFYHNCVGNKNLKGKKVIKQQITPENHVTGDSVQQITEEMSNNNEPKDSQAIAQETFEKENINDPKQNSDNNNVTTETKDSFRSLTNTEEANESNNQEIEKNSEQTLIEGEENHLSDNLCENPEGEVTSGIGAEERSKDLYAENLMDPESPNSTSEPGLEDSLEAEHAIEENNIEMENIEKEPVETRKVPKLSLKLPKLVSYTDPEIEAEDSEDSEKLTMEVDQIESENENDTDINNTIPNPELDLGDRDPEEQIEQVTSEPQPQVAGSDIPILELQLEQPLDKFDPRLLIQKCLKATVSTCIYCNHARKIAVNGQQLGLHCIAEHRFSAVVNSITAEELIPESFVNRIKESLNELESVFFNLDSSFSDEAVTFSHLFECFQCRFSTTVHKELYLHNRKFHSKNLLLCIMCKSNFYSYSELICHLCPGVYVLDYDLQFRCCMCVNNDLPSSFRLMVHLRKKHNVCDVCLEMCHTQYRLSNHVWKHKLHHFCYRCGIAYRNKPDITRHLFWKHGTESVLCKKCMQKKWPHVYHFCVPPTSFTCDECNVTYTRAVSLKVHKRIHMDEKKHPCTFEGCTERFISKKLMLKHEQRHREPPEEIKLEIDTEKPNEEVNENETEENKTEVKEEEKIEDKPKPKIDVLDLPELNLSESDSSDSEAETTNNDADIKDNKTEETRQVEEEKPNELISQENTIEVSEVNDGLTEVDNPTSVIQNIWDNFKNYQANKEKLDNMFSEVEKTEQYPDIPIPLVEEELTVEIALRDHDYCIDPEKKIDTSLIEVKPALTLTESVDHDYCSPKIQPPPTEKSPPQTGSREDVKEEKQKKNAEGSSSGSSSDSDSSSCSCGSNCSCSSSSGSSSSTSESSNSDSSTEEGRRRQQARRQRRKDRAKKLNKESENKVVDVVATDLPPVVETPIRESDLETTESETDEEFYDRAPQKLAKKILEEKRQQLLAIMGPNSVPNGSFIESTSRPPTPPAGVVEEEEEPKPKKKSKSKKRKKKKSDRRAEAEMEDNRSYSSEVPNIPIPSYYQYHQPPTVAPITLTLPRNSPIPNQSALTPPMPAAYPKIHTESSYSRQDSSDSSLRASKRRRVPNKFYGYSSDEDQDKVPSSAPKWRKTEVSQAPQSPMIVPPITIKTTPQPQPTVEPISIRTGTHLSDFKVQRPKPKPSVPPIRLMNPRPLEKDSATESNDSSSEEQTTFPKPIQPQLYCYCRCPYDEVSEMIGCDASDCAIEWFHFECVGIMVPPKGQWFCPDCRKKKQQRRELLQT